MPLNHRSKLPAEVAAGLRGERLSTDMSLADLGLVLTFAAAAYSMKVQHEIDPLMHCAAETLDPLQLHFHLIRLPRWTTKACGLAGNAKRPSFASDTSLRLLLLSRSE